MRWFPAATGALWIDDPPVALIPSIVTIVNAGIRGVREDLFTDRRKGEMQTPSPCILPDREPFAPPKSYA